MRFLPIKNDKIYTLVMKQIQSFLENGELRSGDRLPSEKELTILLGVSRSSIRQAISALETMGVVESRRGYGTIVAEGVAPDSLADLFSHAIVPIQISPLDIVESRLMFECNVAALCAERRQAEHLDKMRDALMQIERSIRSGSPSNPHDRQFHLAIAEGTNNASIVKLMLSINRMLHGNMWKLVREINQYKPLRLQTYTAQHVQLLDAIEARNSPKAEEAMREHLITVRQDLEQDLSEEAGS
jgi:GntR family transcriptional regulator, transcriptional repressor for pyruvate dehydrogenase complex